MSILSLKNVVKKYHNHMAVDHVTLEVPKGKIFGLLGPNGAGKTSLIRMITTITAADEGKILLDGEEIGDHHPNFIGYLPEERGLYKKMKVGEQLIYLAQLKGMSKKQAHEALMQWLTKFGITDWWNKKIEELSKGMQQKIQFISTVVHEPKLLILDEPFSGLDPINTNLIKEEIRNLNRNGVSIIFSTHRMEQVEEICEDMVLINKGKVILSGNVNAIKNQFKENKFRIAFDGSLPDKLRNQYFDVISDTDTELIIQLNEGYKGNDLLSALISQDIEIKSYSEILPSLNEIFIRKVESTI